MRSLQRIINLYVTRQAFDIVGIYFRSIGESSGRVLGWKRRATPREHTASRKTVGGAERFLDKELKAFATDVFRVRGRFLATGSSLYVPGRPVNYMRRPRYIASIGYISHAKCSPFGRHCWRVNPINVIVSSLLCRSELCRARKLHSGTSVPPK
jgi:hypothetical protein